MDERSTIVKIEKKLKAYDFIKVEQGNVINMSKIFEIGLSSLKLDNDQSIPLSRKNRMYLLDEYNKFFTRRRV